MRVQGARSGRSWGHGSTGVDSTPQRIPLAVAMLLCKPFPYSGNEMNKMRNSITCSQEAFVEAEAIKSVLVKKLDESSNSTERVQPPQGRIA